MMRCIGVHIACMTSGGKPSNRIMIDRSDERSVYSLDVTVDGGKRETLLLAAMAHRSSDNEWKPRLVIGVS